MPLETRPFVAAVHLESEEAQTFYLEDAVQTGEAAFIADAIGVVAKARGLTELARELGLARAELTEALWGFSGPDMQTLLAYARALGAQVEGASAPAASTEEPAPAAA